MARTRIPAIEGWFTDDEDAPALLARRGAESGSWFFPPTLAVSADPRFPFEETEVVPMSRRGRVWSWTTNHYQPPEPYVASDPFVPYTVVAAELEDEGLVVLGPLATGADAADLAIGTTVVLVLGPLFVDDEHEHVVWQWAPVGSAR